MALAGLLAGVWSTSLAPLVIVSIEVLNERKPTRYGAYSLNCGFDGESTVRYHASDAPSVMTGIITPWHVKMNLIARLEALYPLDGPGF